MEPIGATRGNSTDLDAVFAALADPTRRAILSRLASGAASVNEIAQPFQLTQPAISKHLRVLERAGLISGGREAQRRPRTLEPMALAAAEQWLEPFRKLWEARYEALDAVLAEQGERELQQRPLGKRRKKASK
jgi:DNA-binding transcriptional ArsR family regulator